MSIFDRIIRRHQDPPPIPDQQNRTVRKAALAGPTYKNKNYINYAAFPDRDPGATSGEPHDQVIRRAVHYTNAQLGIQGLVRTDFSKELNDRLAQNAVFSLCEKAMIDYFGTAAWEIVDDAGKPQTDAMRWLRRPNPHQTWNMVLKESIRDTIRYDAGVIVNSLRADGTLGEVRAFHGPDFWIEVDRDWTALDGIGSQYYGPWSHGQVKRYWQHSRPGIYIPFEPREICYFMLYPRTDSMYGTDFLSRIRWQLEYLIDSTRAAGMTFANGIAPGAIWKHPDYTSIEELAERELDIELNHLGAENFGGIIHLIGNESIESFTPTLHDMQWIEGQKYFTEMVLAMFGFASSEFFQGDVNRATAYISRNITKSRMLYPLQVSYEQMITAKILPLMEGWDDSWEFRFIDTVDLDDDLKRAQINQTRAATAQAYAMLGLSIESALELAEVPDDLRTAVREDLDELKNQEGNWTEGLPIELSPEEAQQYTEDYQGTAVDGDDAENREDGVQKARIYLNPGEKPPEGVQVKTGPRGGRYYEPGPRSEGTRPGEGPRTEPPERDTAGTTTTDLERDLKTFRDEYLAKSISTRREYGRGYGKDGRPLFTISGGDYEIDLSSLTPEEKEQLAGGVIVHTHPLPMGPSDNDAVAHVLLRVRETRIESEHYSYSFTRDEEHGNPPPVAIREAFEEIYADNDLFKSYLKNYPDTWMEEYMHAIWSQMDERIARAGYPGRLNYRRIPR